MIRLDEIKKKMLELEEETPNWKDTTVYVAGFMDGAMWADQHPHWISVEDELPPVNEAFIAYWNNFVIVQQGRDERFGNNKHITHWMPLPQAPKKGGKK